MARLRGAFSGEQLSIFDELFARAAVMKNTPAFDPERVCFLVDDGEWDELNAYMQRFQRMTNDDGPLPTKKMFVDRIEVRKRGT